MKCRPKELLLDDKVTLKGIKKISDKRRTRSGVGRGGEGIFRGEVSRVVQRRRHVTLCKEGRAFNSGSIPGESIIY